MNKRNLLVNKRSREVLDLYNSISPEMADMAFDLLRMCAERHPRTMTVAELKRIDEINLAEPLARKRSPVSAGLMI